MATVWSAAATALQICSGLRLLHRHPCFFVELRKGDLTDACGDAFNMNDTARIELAGDHFSAGQRDRIRLARNRHVVLADELKLHERAHPQLVACRALRSDELDTSVVHHAEALSVLPEVSSAAGVNVASCEVSSCAG